MSYSVGLGPFLLLAIAAACFARSKVGRNPRNNRGPHTLATRGLRRAVESRAGVGPTPPATSEPTRRPEYRGAR